MAAITSIELENLRQAAARGKSPNWTKAQINVANQVILQAGTYELDAIAPAIGVGAHQARWQNITDGVTTILGQNSHCAAAAVTGAPAFVKGIFTIAAQKTFELQHWGATTVATFGFGVQSNLGIEVYSSVYLKKIA